jgi:hypothetical protein
MDKETKCPIYRNGEIENVGEMLFCKNCGAFIK